MKRRDFIKLSTVLGASMFMPNITLAKEFKIEDINFNSSIYNQNNAQTIIINMYGGASQLSGNITNIEEIEKNSQTSYFNYFRNITKTKNGCWQEAGGKHMEELLAGGDMTLYRCCYSAIREANNNKSHGTCMMQNQKGSFDTSGGGIVTNLAAILEANGVINEDMLMPFVTMDGDSQFYAQRNKPLKSFLKPIGIDENFDNPYAYKIWSLRRWYYYTEEERKHENYSHSNEEGGFDPKFVKDMDRVAQSHNSDGKIKNFFTKREKLASFIENIKKAETPDLGENAYLEDHFAKKVEAAIKLLDKNPDTKVITIGTGGLGGWDDHNEARDYVPRMEALFKTMKSAMAHLKAIGKDGNINILIFAEFGRNVNLNSANGWDHGNLQNFYVLGGKDYFTHKGVVGETVVDVTGQLNRLWLKPKSGTYWFEPISVASTIYKLYGIENPNVLTGGNFESVNVLS
jgi:hypothetical protein